MSPTGRSPAESKQPASSRLTERLKSLVTIGAVPGALVGFIGDLFTPLNGWVIVLALGLLASLFAVYVTMRLSFGRSLDKSWWHRVTINDPATAWYWNSASPWRSHGVHVVLVFALTCFLVAAKSHENQSNGGILAAQFSIASDLQKVLSAVKQLEPATSPDPSKELNKLGFPPNLERFAEAIETHHYRAIELFLQLEIGVNSGQLVTAYLARDDRIFNLFASRPDRSNGEGCIRLFGVLRPQDVVALSEAEVRMFKSLCNHTNVHAMLNGKIAEELQKVTAAKSAYAAEVSQSKTVAECAREELRDRAMPLMAEAARFNLNQTYDTPRKEMLANLYVVVLVNNGRGDVAGIVRKYCEAQSNPQLRYSDRELTKWKQLLAWSS